MVSLTSKLKKLIKNVATELEDMGLPPSVLHRLLVTEGTAGGSSDGSTPAAAETEGDTPMSEDNSVFEFEFEVDGGKTRVSPKEVQVDPVVDDFGDFAGPSVPKDHTHRFRLRMRDGASETTPQEAGNYIPLGDGGSPRPVSVTEMLRTRSEVGSSFPPPSASLLPSSVESRRIVYRPGADGNVSAEYVLAGG